MKILYVKICIKTTYIFCEKCSIDETVKPRVI